MRSHDSHSGQERRGVHVPPRQLFIDGQWAEAASGKTFETPNPATGETLARVAEGDAEDIDRAVRAARRAFDEGPWAGITPSERGRMIWRIGDLILEHAGELAQLESLDNGKPYAVALAADVPLAADLFHYMAGWATKIEGNTINISVPYMPGANFHSYTLREPVGVVGQIIPWNFPLLMAAWKLGPALTTGNTVILTRWPRRSGPGRSGSTATTCSTHRCRSAGTSSPAGAARWATRCWRPTPR